MKNKTLVTIPMAPICECTQLGKSLGRSSLIGDLHGRPPFSPPRLDHSNG